jgi:tetratricopeptide (TPR) repeat protein
VDRAQTSETKRSQTHPLLTALNSPASLLKSKPDKRPTEDQHPRLGITFLEAILNKRRFTLALLFGLVLTFSLAARLQAQPSTGTQGPVTEDEFKVTTYKRFTDNREPNPAAAYQAAKDYMARYNKEDDQYTRYLKQWMAAFEKDDRQDTLLRAIYGEKNYAAGFGLAKQVLTDDPEDIKSLIALGYGGYLATTNAKNETFNADSVRYAQKAIQLLEGGKTPEPWDPFKSREDTIASLNYAVGFIELKPRPEEAITRFLRVIQIDSDLRKTPSPFFLLAGAYEKGPYQRLSSDYGKRFANQPETPESKAALENINKVMDRIIDAYARAIALAGTNPQYQAGKTEWTKQLTTLYKFRHENSDAGLNEFIAGVLAKPMPQP